MRFKRICAAVLAGLLGTGAFSMPVLANAGGADAVQTETAASSEAADDSREKETEELPLTPDGNLTLVDDIGGTDDAGKQFITLTPKDGNYFYLLIDRDDKGNENVHFLNQVDEADLFSLMDEEEAAAMKEKISAEAAEEQEESQPVVTPTEPAAQEEAAPQQEQSSKLPYAVGLVLLLSVFGAGGVFFFLKNRKQKTESDRPDPDADYREDEEEYDIPEEADETEDEESGEE